MSKEVNIRGLVSSLLYGSADGTDRCQICLDDTTPGAVMLGDAVSLDCSYTPKQITLREILNAVTGYEVDTSLSNTLCMSCSYTAISSYAFIKLCEESKTRCLNLCRIINDKVNIPKLENDTNGLYIYSDVSKTGLSNVKKSHKTEERKQHSNKLQCAKCGKMFRNAYLLRKHSAVHLVNLECQYCLKVCVSRSKLEVHIARLHKEKKFKCKMCPKMYGSEYLVSEHEKQHCELNCKICKKFFTKRTSLRAHEASHSAHPCENCGKVFRFKQSFNAHKCGDNATYVCDDCRKCYWSKNTLKKHIEHEHSGNAVKCDVCQKKFYTKSRLYDHMATHTGVKNHACDICGGLFMTKANLTKHIQGMHTGEKPVKCTLCDLRFLTSYRRLEHMRKKHDAPAPTCSVCGKKFAALRDMNKHCSKHFDPSSKLFTAKKQMRNEIVFEL